MHVKVDGGINALSTSKDSSQVVVAGRSGEYEGCGQEGGGRECRGRWRYQCSQHIKGFLTGCGGW